MIRKHTRRAAKAAFAISLGVAIVIGLFAAAFARPGRSVVAVPLGADAVASAATHIAVRRGRVPLRR